MQSAFLQWIYNILFIISKNENDSDLSLTN